jgi:hypothetical protein
MGDPKIFLTLAGKSRCTADAMGPENLTPTGAVVGGIHRTLGACLNREFGLSKRNFLTGQSVAGHPRPNLQGGGRWFEPSIAHYKTTAKQRFLWVRNDGRKVYPGPFTATRLERAGIQGTRRGRR